MLRKSLIIILFSFIISCGDLFRSLPDLLMNKAVLPKVVYTYPADKAEGVELGKSVIAGFNKEMDESAINNSTFKVKKTDVIDQATTIETVIDGDISVYNKDTIIFRIKDDKKMERQSRYSIFISKDVKDRENNKLQDNYTWEFKTGDTEDTTGPVVIVAEPVMFIYSTDNIIAKAVFNEDVDPFSISTSNFILKKLKNSIETAIPGTVSYTASSKSALFIPGSLEAETSYKAVISGVKDLSGNSMTGEFLWDFRHLKTYNTPCEIPGLVLDCCSKECE
jgi:hypothetical protein